MVILAAVSRLSWLWAPPRPGKGHSYAPDLDPPRPVRRYVPLVALSQERKPDPAAAFKLGDADKDGKLTQAEFLKLVANAPELKDNPDLAKQVFDLLDADKNGSLSARNSRRSTSCRSRRPRAEEKKAAPAGRSGRNPAEPANASGFNDKPTQEQVAFFEKKIRPVLVEQLLQVPLGRRREGQGRPAARHPRRRPQGRRHRAGGRARRPGREPAHPGAPAQGRRRCRCRRRRSCPTR